MKNLDKNQFDEIFRAGLIAPDQLEVDEDWALLKSRLQNQKRQNKMTYYMTLVSSGAAYQNNHFFGIANLNLSYKRNLSNNVKLAFNPYLKLPLTDLGYGHIRLRSAGMSVGVITNLNKAEK